MFETPWTEWLNWKKLNAVDTAVEPLIYFAREREAGGKRKKEEAEGAKERNSRTSHTREFDRCHGK